MVTSNAYILFYRLSPFPRAQVTQLFPDMGVPLPPAWQVRTRVARPPRTAGFARPPHARVQSAAEAAALWRRRPPALSPFEAARRIQHAVRERQRRRRSRSTWPDPFPDVPWLVVPHWWTWEHTAGMASLVGVAWCCYELVPFVLVVLACLIALAHYVFQDEIEEQ